MENGIKMRTSEDLKPYEVKQALAGMAFGREDDTVFKYLNAFSGIIPVQSLQILHVVPDVGFIDSLFGEPSDSIFNVSFSFETEEVEMKNRIAEALPKGLKIPFEISVTEGDPLEKFLETAKNINSDLLVLGRKAGDVKHGILAKNLTRKTESDVLVIPENSKTKISNILVPIDFSPNAARALKAAVRIHKQLKKPGKITVLHVYSMPNVSSLKISRSQEQFKKMIEKNLEDAFDAFLQTEVGNYKKHIKISLTEKEMPGTAQYILDYAESENSDFMVIGAKGHSKIHLLLMGSVSESVFDRNDFIPALIVK